MRYLDYVRNLRRQTQYDVGFSPDMEEITDILPKIEEFIGVVEKLV